VRGEQAVPGDVAQHGKLSADDLAEASVIAQLLHGFEPARQQVAVEDDPHAEERPELAAQADERLDLPRAADLGHVAGCNLEGNRGDHVARVPARVQDFLARRGQ